MDRWDPWTRAGVKQRRGTELFARLQAHEPVTKFSTGVASSLMTKDTAQHPSNAVGANSCAKVSYPGTHGAHTPSAHPVTGREARAQR